MSEFKPETTVAELAVRHPGLLKILTSSGLYREGEPADATLDGLCAAFGLHSGIIIRMLDSAAAKLLPAAPPVDAAPFQAMPLGGLVEHIEQAHHAFLRQALPPLVELAEGLAAARADDSRLAELRDEVRELADELNAHLAHEEEALFPMIRDLAAGGAVQPTRCGSAVGGPIACMENEHARTAVALNRIRELTDDYRVASDAESGWRELVNGLAAVEQDLVEHIYKEDEVLFPRALGA
jgi:regulator of cell morphogenesis and NO signaling